MALLHGSELGPHEPVSRWWENLRAFWKTLRSRIQLLGLPLHGYWTDLLASQLSPLHRTPHPLRKTIV